MTTQTTSPFDVLAARARSLYSMPAVAMEVIRLTDTPQVDTRALKECIERDPALTAKLLRVVNSSLFGLSGKVENLTQAIALLGIKPLKLLVLGFSLPDGLLDELDAEGLRHYWRGALTRAVAARQLAESQWGLPGDDAFLVALLQDIGKLVLLQQIGTPYARFLAQVRTEQQSLAALESDSLGFDHRQLTARLLRDWHLPEVYARSIEAVLAGEVGQRCDDPANTIPQVLELANLLAELVDEHRLNVLPELLERGEQYCGLTSDSLRELVVELQPQVEQLGEVLRLDLGNGADYRQTLLDAYARLAAVAESAAGDLVEVEDRSAEQILRESQDLGISVREFLLNKGVDPAPLAPGDRADGAQPSAAPPPQQRSPRIKSGPRAAAERLVARVTSVAAACRSRREPLALVLLEVACDGPRDTDAAVALRKLVQTLSDENQLDGQAIFTVRTGTYAAILEDHERRDAVAMVQHALSLVTRDLSSEIEIKVGAAFIASIPKGFDAGRLVEAAENCLAAAHASGGHVIKSIEVY